jgi:Phage Terminase
LRLLELKQRGIDVTPELERQVRLLEQQSTAIEAFAQQQETVGELMQETWENTLASIQSLTADTFENVLRGEITRFEDFASAVKDIFIRLAADIATLIERALERIGVAIPLDPHGQGYRDMSSALDQVEALALNGRLRHGNHPALSWCPSNAIVTKDAAGNRKLDRSRATGRIDGLVAAVLAVSAMSGTPEPVEPSYQIFIL